MFKRIPGNHEYIISSYGDIRTINGKKTSLNINDGKVNINLYGKERVVCLKWLGLLSHYEVDLPDNLNNIEFVDCNPKATNQAVGKLMVFKKPITIVKDNIKFRIIPNYTRYAINLKGQLYDIVRDKFINYEVNENEYISINIYDPDKGKFKLTYLHRLVALTWVKNSDFLEKPYVNHIDGKKHNFYYSNLEWCSNKENIRHAFKTGLLQFRKYKVRDSVTGKIEIYNSWAEVRDNLKLPKNSSFSSVELLSKVKNVFHNRYQVKTLDDNTEWNLPEDFNTVKNKFTIKVTYSDGTHEIFNRLPDIIKKFGLWQISYNIKEVIRLAELKRPDIKIEYTDNFEHPHIEALNLVTKEVLETENYEQMSLLTGKAPNTIRAAIYRGKIYNCGGYAFRFKSDDDWPDKIESLKGSSKYIYATNKDGITIKEFQSLTKASEYFSISVFLLKKILDKNEYINGWKFDSIINTGNSQK